MKNIFCMISIRLVLFLSLIVVQTIPISGQVFQKLYGTSAVNSFSKVIEQGTDYYLLGSQELTPGGLRRATVTKIDATGNWVWTTGLNIPSQWNDIIIEPISGEFLLVGHTLPYNSSNESLIGRIDHNGSFAWVRSYDESGQETYNRIRYNPNSNSPLYPFYILGKEADIVNGGNDVVVLNLDENGNFWIKSLIATVVDDEIANDLEVLPGGDMIISGGNPGIWGVVLRLDNTGAMVNGLTPFGELLTYTDLFVQPATGYVYTIANSTVNSNTYVFKFDDDLFFPLWEYELIGLTSVHQIWSSTQTDFYVTGTGVFNGMSRTVLMRFQDLGSSISLQWLKFLDNGEVAYEEGYSARLSSNRIGVVDGRTPGSGGLGLMDAFMSASDMDLTTCMTQQNSVAANPIAFSYNGPVFPIPAYDSLPTGITELRSMLACSEVDLCASGPCVAAFSFTLPGNCGNVQFTDLSTTGSSIVQYCWDFDGNLNTCEASTPNPLWQSHPCIGVNACLIITAADGCKDTICQSVYTPDNIPPLITCPPNITLNFPGPAPCSQQVSITSPIAADQCDPNVTLTNSYNGTSDASDIYQNGTTTVIFTATDDCGNSVTCSFTVTVNCVPAGCGKTVVTCYSPVSTQPVAAIYDTRFNSTAPMGDDWTNVPVVHPANWTQNGIGNVFGIALDHQGEEIYLTATDIYASDFSFYYNGVLNSAAGPGGTAGVYKTNINTPNSTSTIVYTTNASGLSAYNAGNLIPNKGGLGNGIGNIVFDQPNQQLFLTNLEDGFIYRISTSGNLLSAFDPFGPDSGINGLQEVPEERIWGIGILGNRIYFAREKGIGSPQQIWSIGLNGAEFASSPVVGSPGLWRGAEVLEINSIPGTQKRITDLEFAFDGRMLLAERGDPHHAQVFEYKNAGTWASTGVPHYVGSGPGENCAGGVDYGYLEKNGDPIACCDELVWATGNCMSPQGVGPWNICNVYGIEGMLSTGNAIAPGNGMMDLFIDYDHVYGGSSKFQIADVDVFKCGCSSAPINQSCDSLYVWDSLWTQGLCCHSMNFYIQVPVAYIQAISITPNVTFYGATLSSPFVWHASNNGSTILAFKHNASSTILPYGPFYSALNFCLGGITSSTPIPQEVVFNYYAIGASGVPFITCSDTLEFYCPPPVLGDTCVVVKSDTVYCTPNPYEYCLDFTVQNVSTNLSFVANQVILSGLTPGFSFKPCPPPSISVTSSSISIPLNPLLYPTQISNALCAKIVATTPILSPTQVCMDLVLSSNDTCCHSSIPFCVTLYPCCNPCVDRGFVVQTPDLDSCCHSLDIINVCQYNYFTGLQIELLTSGVNFGSHFTGGPNPGDWHNSQSSPMLIEWNHVSGFIPHGTIPGLINFCLDDIDPGESPQTVVLHWMTPGSNATDSIACSDTLIFNCPPTSYGCITALNDTVNCAMDINGNTFYQYELTFQNTSAPPHTATHFNFQQIGGPPVTVFPNPVILNPIMNPSSIQTINTNIFGTNLNPGDKLTFLVRLADFVNTDDWCCHEADTLCIFIPSCDTCICTGFGNLLFSYSNGFVGWQIGVGCNDGGIDTLPCIPPGELYHFKGDLFVADSCNANVSYDIISQATNMPIASGIVPVVPISSNVGQFDITAGFNPPPGNYQLVLSGHAGFDSCLCVIDFFIPYCDTCFCSDVTDIVLDYGGTLSDSVACWETINLVQGLPLTVDGNTLCNGDQCGPNSPVSWALYLNPQTYIMSGSITSSPNFSLTLPPSAFSIPGTYALYLVSYCGSTTDSCLCAIFLNSMGVGTSDFEITKNLSIYPNPNTGEFTVDLTDFISNATSVRILDLTGDIVSERKVERADPLQNVNARQLPSGMYFLQVLSNGRVISVNKFVKL